MTQTLKYPYQIIEELDFPFLLKRLLTDFLSDFEFQLYCRSNPWFSQNKLIWASIEGHLEVVRLLLDHGADVHANYDDALSWASENGHWRVVQLLLDHGANVHAEDDDALKLSSLNGQLEVVQLLLDHGADVHAGNDQALRWASMNGYSDVVHALRKK